MGYRRSATLQVADNNPNRKSHGSRGSTNEMFRVGVNTSIANRGGSSTIRVPLGTKGRRNKATK
jgi:hypothetical protein